MAHLTAYLIEKPENQKIVFLYVPGKAILEYENGRLKIAIEPNESSKELDSLKVNSPKVNVSEQTIRFLLDTSRRLERVKARLTKHGDKLSEIIQRDFPKSRV